MKTNRTESRSVTSFFEREYTDFAMYTVEHRAIPSVVDGFKPSHRKVVWVANGIWKSGKEPTQRLHMLMGRVAYESKFHHTPDALCGAMVSLARRDKNSLPVLEEDGQFGSMREPEPGAPRYIGTRLSSNFRLLYKDFDLLSPQVVDGEEVEPSFFLPVVPTVILNGTSGIAIGFSTDILNRNPLEVVDACLAVLDGKKVRELRPWIRGWTGSFVAGKEKNKWTARGAFERVNSTTVRVTELPPSITYEKYEAHLAGMLERREIVSFDDTCSNNVDYAVRFRAEDLEKMDDAALDKALMISESVTEQLNALDERGRLRCFSSVEDIVSYFVTFRLTFYEQRKQKVIQDAERRAAQLEARAAYVKAVVEGDIVLFKSSTDEVLARVAELGLPQIDGSHRYLLSVPNGQFTPDSIPRLQAEAAAEAAAAAATRQLNPVDMYRDDLRALRADIVKNKLA